MATLFWALVGALNPWDFSFSSTCFVLRPSCPPPRFFCFRSFLAEPLASRHLPDCPSSGIRSSSPPWPAMPGLVGGALAASRRLPLGHRGPARLRLRQRPRRRPPSPQHSSLLARPCSLEMAEVTVLTTIRATRRAKDPLWLCSSRAQRTRHIAPLVVIRRKCQRWRSSEEQGDWEQKENKET